MGNKLTDKEKEEIQEEIREQRKFENQSVDKIFLAQQLEPLNKKLDKLLHKIDLLTQGAISTVTGVDEINDKELQEK